MANCTIVRWNPDRGFGFVRLEDGREAFLHVTDIEPRQPRDVDLRGKEIEVHRTTTGPKGLRVASGTIRLSAVQVWSERPRKGELSRVVLLRDRHACVLATNNGLTGKVTISVFEPSAEFRFSAYGVSPVDERENLIVRILGVYSEDRRSVRRRARLVSEVEARRASPDPLIRVGWETNCEYSNPDLHEVVRGLAEIFEAACRIIGSGELAQYDLEEVAKFVGEKNPTRYKEFRDGDKIRLERELLKGGGQR